MSRIRLRQVLGVAGAVALCEAAGGAGALASRRGLADWYGSLKKPGFNPPSWVFGPVWTFLYALMGLSLFVVSSGNAERRQRLWGIFGIQLLLNALWPVLFFGRRSPFAGLIGIYLLLISVLGTVVSFWRVSRPAGLLLVPYAVWTAFASVLNARIWQLNRS